MALLSTLKIIDKTRVRKARILPAPGDVLVKVGDAVKPDTVIARAEFVRGNPYVVDLRSELKQNVDPHFVDSVLVKKAGDIVKAKEVIAKYQKSFWSELIEVKSPCDGVIEYISRTRGQIIIREDPKSANPVGIVAAASKLQVWPRLLRMYTTVREGDEVFEGQIIATTQGVSSLDYVYAPMAGIVQKICTLTGTIVIVKPIKHTKVLAHIAGTVTEILPNSGAVIESAGAYIQGVFGIGGERFGRLVIPCESPYDVLDAGKIDDSAANSILVAGSFASSEAIAEARSKGAVGLITGGINQRDLVSVLGRELSVGITGHEESDFTVIVLEGFGNFPANQETWEILKANQGKVASINGTTHIRAGVVRPEIIISDSMVELGDEAIDSLDLAETFSAPRAVTEQVAEGDRVRCTRPPYFGLWGLVEEVPLEQKKIQCEVVTEVAKVRLDTGPVVTVPQANLEIFRARE